MISLYLYDTSLRFIKVAANSINVKLHTIVTSGHYVNDAQLIKAENTGLKDTLFLLSVVEEGFPDEPLDIDYRIIEAFRPTQLKVLRYMERLGLENYKIEQIYFKVLSYFYKRFKSGELNAVMTVLPLHGSPLESIPIDIALYFNYPVYTIDKLYANTDFYDLWAVWDYTNNDYVDISDIFEPSQLDHYLFYKTKRTPPTCKEKLYNQPIAQLSGINKSVFIFKAILKTRFKALPPKAIINSFMGRWPTLGFCYLWLMSSKIRFSYKVIKKAKTYYNKTSQKADFNKNYIYYPLHLDPEASTMVRETLSNQLTILKMISVNLPQGYYLYVKEHPVVFSFLKPKRLTQAWYFHLTMWHYRGTDYYKEIEKLPNVKLISLKHTSEELIKYSKGIATINGTVCLEASKSNKPMLIFGNKLVASKMDGVFNVSNTEQCKLALNSINEGHLPIYNPEIMTKYLFELYGAINASGHELYDLNSEKTKKLITLFQKLFNQSTK